MFVCICNAVTDKQIKEEVAQGATTMRDLSQKLAVGNQCGKCCCCAKKVLNQALVQIANAEPQVA